MAEEEEEEEVRVAKRGQISTAIPTKTAEEEEEEEEEEEVRVAKRGKISTAIPTKMAEEEEEVRVAKRGQISTAIPTKMAEEEEEVRVAKRGEISTAIPTKMAEEEEEVRVAKRGKISTAIPTKMAEEEEVSAFLNKLKTLDFAIYNFQKDLFLNSYVVRNGMLDRSKALRLYETSFRDYNGRAPFQGMDVGNAKNLSHDDLNKITNNFSDCIWKDKNVIFYHGVMDDGQEVTVKTWEFTLPPRSCKNYPRSFHVSKHSVCLDCSHLTVLLILQVCNRMKLYYLKGQRSPLKSCPFLVKLNGFCFEKKLALVYDLKYKRTLKELCRCDEFGWKERMKVANDYALLLKTLTMVNLDLFWTSDGIAIDEEYNIKVMNFRIGCRTDENSGVGAGFISDDADFAEELAKAYVYEFGALLVELIVKWLRDFDHEFKLRSDILEMKEGSEFHKALEALEIDADTGDEITKLIGSCMHVKPERPCIDYAISELKRIVGS